MTNRKSLEDVRKMSVIFISLSQEPGNTWHWQSWPGAKTGATPTLRDTRQGYPAAPLIVEHREHTSLSSLRPQSTPGIWRSVGLLSGKYIYISRSELLSGGQFQYWISFKQKYLLKKEQIFLKENLETKEKYNSNHKCEKYTSGCTLYLVFR